MSPPHPTDPELDDIAESLAPFGTRMILTGAGFSKPWGGYLASEIWSVIVSDPSLRGRTELNLILRAELNFESVLAKIEQGTSMGNVSDDDRAVMRASVMRAFDLQEEHIDEMERRSAFWSVAEQIVHRFTADQVTNCFFTLKQDLLLERVANRCLGLDLLVPGMSSGLPDKVRGHTVRRGSVPRDQGKALLHQAARLDELAGGG